jgi:hypothetical protein
MAPNRNLRNGRYAAKRARQTYGRRQKVDRSEAAVPGSRDLVPARWRYVAAGSARASQAIAWFQKVP